MIQNTMVITEKKLTGKRPITEVLIFFLFKRNPDTDINIKIEKNVAIGSKLNLSKLSLI